MQVIAMSWLVFKLTHSSFLLGVIGFTSQIPTFLFGPLAGVLVDRCNRHRLIIATQALAMLQALILAMLTLYGHIAVWHLIVLSTFLGLINAFDIPGRQAFLIDMVEKREDFGNAIALNSSMFNGAKLLGPSLAGILIAWLGEGICFLINGLSYLAIIVALLAIKIKQKKNETQGTHLGQELWDGFKYVIGFAPVRSILLLLVVISFLGMPFMVLMPVFATNVLHGGADTLGFLVGASGVGALVGSFYLASRKTVLGLGKLIALASFIFGLGLVAFSLSPTLWLSFIFLFLVGFGMMVQLAASNTLLQTIVDDGMRGRLMGFFMMSFIGIEPFGSLAAGSLADVIGARTTIFIGGLCCIIGSICFAKKLPAIKEMVRPIYLKMGILSEIASGI